MVKANSVEHYWQSLKISALTKIKFLTKTKRTPIENSNDNNESSLVLCNEFKFKVELLFWSSIYAFVICVKMVLNVSNVSI